ncbi:MAG: SDR family NAD(P)-dependent oxidoreductase [Actinomycetota bacterium]|nr:SDR family NAD(P)-dependent oxidoreductase [Actinomycetota bacterium]
MHLDGKVAVVTGGASGIGAALCRALAAAGADTVIVADRDEKGAESVAAAIAATGCRVEPVHLDVSIADQVETMVRRVEAEHERIDIYFSNAGIMVAGGVEVPDEDWDRIWAVNLMSHVYAARYVLPHMVARSDGYLVFTASAAGLLTQLGAAPYSVTKHAVVALAEWLQITYARSGIRVSCVCPEAVRTNLVPELAARTPPAAGSAVSQAARDGILEPEHVAVSVMEALADERFLVLPHPEVATYEQRRTADRDRWLAGMARLLPPPAATG